MDLYLPQLVMTDTWLRNLYCISFLFLKKYNEKKKTITIKVRPLAVVENPSSGFKPLFGHTGALINLEVKSFF